MRKRKPTPAQIQASRRNGARSTGPLTPQTRALSARNALTHGLTASTILLDGESRERSAHAVKAWSKLHQRRGNEFHNLLLQQARVNQQLDRAYRHFCQFTALRRQSAEPEQLRVFEHQNGAETAPTSPQPIDSPIQEQENAK